MTKSIILGNGNMSVLMDCNYFMNELYYPLTTINNAVAIRIGLYHNNKFAWLYDLNPDIKYNMDQSSNVNVKFNGITLELTDTVDFTYNALIRKLHVTGNGETRIFFAHDLNIDGSIDRNTAIYDPETDSLLHYKDDKWFLISSDLPIFEYATGFARSDGGTWMDCEDGHLEGNPVAQGDVDSAISIKINDEKTFYSWIIAGKSYNDATSINNKIKNIIKPENAMVMSGKFRTAWLSKIYDYPDYVKTSLSILRPHCQNNGAIIAGLDNDIMKFNKDNYNYLWHRDASFVSIAFSLLNYIDQPRLFLSLSKNMLMNDGCFFQKYTSDGNWGSTWQPWTLKYLPIQEDETALFIYATWLHYVVSKDVDFISSIYNPYIIKAADFIVNYTFKNGMPKPSFDLWEEKYGVNIFTLASIYKGLMCASNFADLFGEKNHSNKYNEAAIKIKSIIDKMFLNDHFAKYIQTDECGNILKMDNTVDASSLFVSLFGVYSPKDEKVIENRETIENTLKFNGGIARYENDMYLRGGKNPNEWFITTLWLAQQYALENNNDIAKQYLNWALSKSLKTGMMPEQITGDNKYPSVCPLAWSHAEVIRTYYAIKYNKIEP